jgi:hypothetical protein
MIVFFGCVTKRGICRSVGLMYLGLTRHQPPSHNEARPLAWSVAQFIDDRDLATPP